MKAKLTQGKFRFALGRVGQLFSLVVWSGSSYSDLFQCVRAEHVCFGNRCRGWRNLQVSSDRTGNHLCYWIS